MERDGLGSGVVARGRGGQGERVGETGDRTLVQKYNTEDKEKKIQDYTETNQFK